MPVDTLEMPDVSDWEEGARPTALYTLYTDLNEYAVRHVLLIRVTLREISVSCVLWEMFPCCGRFAFLPPPHLHPQSRSRGFSLFVGCKSCCPDALQIYFIIGRRVEMTDCYLF